jgi:hypothetical protein
MDEFRLAGASLLLPVLGRPYQHGAQRIRVARPVEEIVGRRLGLAALPGRIGEGRRIGAGDIRDLILRNESGKRLGIGGAPALDRRDLVAAGPFLVLRHRARHLVAVVDGVDIELLAVDAALLVDPGERIGDALPEWDADVGRGAAEIRQVADGDLRLGRAGSRSEKQRQRGAPQNTPVGHRFPPLGIALVVAVLNARTDRASSKL